MLRHILQTTASHAGRAEQRRIVELVHNELARGPGRYTYYVAIAEAVAGLNPYESEGIVRAILEGLKWGSHTMQGLLSSICDWLATFCWLRPIETLNTARLINSGFPAVELMFDGELDFADWRDTTVVALSIAQPMVADNPDDVGQLDFQQYVLQMEQSIVSSLRRTDRSEIWPILQLIPDSIVQAVIEQPYGDAYSHNEFTDMRLTGSTLDELTKRIPDATPGVGIAIAYALGYSSSDLADRTLEELAKSGDPRVEYECVHSFHRIQCNREFDSLTNPLYQLFDY